MDAGRLINTETLVRILCGSCTKGDGEGACAQLCPVISAIEKTPTANAVRVVRCAECIEYCLSNQSKDSRNFKINFPKVKIMP